MKKISIAFIVLTATVVSIISGCEKNYVQPVIPVSHSFSESFDSVANLYNEGWAIVNNSQPIGVLPWFQGNATVFQGFSSRASSNEYIAVNFNSTNSSAGVGNISNWLISPEVEMKNGDKISFYVRTVANNTRAERLQLRLNPTDNSTDVGTTWNSTGKFSTLLLDINPNYAVGATGFPATWTKYEVTLSGLPAPLKRRFALRYFVENGGTGGTRSNFIGIDDVEFTSL